MNTNPEERKRGKAFKTLLFDAIRDQCLLDANDNSTKEEVERLYIGHIAARAFDKDDKDSGTLLKETLSKSYPGLKSTLPSIHFELPENATPLQKANAILDAVASGTIPPDVGAILVQAAKHTIDIEMATELKDRMDKIEESLGINV